jgi:hypothetical protein
MSLTVLVVGALEIDDAGCATLFLGVAVGRGVERRGAALHCGLHGERGAEGHAVGGACLGLLAVVVVLACLGALALVLTYLFEGEDDVCGVGIIDDGELSPTLQAFKGAGFDGVVVSVVDDSDGLRGEDGSWNRFSLREGRSGKEKTERKRH